MNSESNLSSIFQSVCQKPFQMRLLQKDDFDKFYFETLGNLTSAPKLTCEEFEEEFNLQQNQDLVNYIHIVIENTDLHKIVAAGSLIVEKNIIGNIGHIEGIVVAKEHEGHGLGSKIMKALNRIGLETQHCIKCSLYCKKSNVGFYQKLGYVEEGDECFQRK